MNICAVLTRPVSEVYESDRLVPQQHIEKFVAQPPDRGVVCQMMGEQPDRWRHIRAFPPAPQLLRERAMILLSAAVWAFQSIGSM